MGVSCMPAAQPTCCRACSRLGVAAQRQLVGTTACSVGRATIHSLYYENAAAAVCLMEPCSAAVCHDTFQFECCRGLCCASLAAACSWLARVCTACIMPGVCKPCARRMQAMCKRVSAQAALCGLCAGAPVCHLRQGGVVHVVCWADYLSGSKRSTRSP